MRRATPELKSLIDAQPDFDSAILKEVAEARLMLPNQWGRISHDQRDRISVTVPTPKVTVQTGSEAELTAAREEVTRLRVELARQDAQLTTMLSGSPEPAAAAAAPSAPIQENMRLSLSTVEVEKWLIRGFSAAESWGRWTDGLVAVFRCRHPARAAPAAFEFWPTMTWGGDDDGKEVGVAVNGAPGGRSPDQSGRAGAS